MTLKGGTRLPARVPFFSAYRLTNDEIQHDNPRGKNCVLGGRPRPFSNGGATACLFLQVICTQIPLDLERPNSERSGGACFWGNSQDPQSQGVQCWQILGGAVYTILSHRLTYNYQIQHSIWDNMAPLRLNENRKHIRTPQRNTKTQKWELC